MKRSPGRPQLPGRRITVKLEESHLARACDLGHGKVAAGIRVALSGESQPKERIAAPVASLDDALDPPIHDHPSKRPG